MSQQRRQKSIPDGFVGQRMVVVPGPVRRSLSTRPALTGLLPTAVGYFPTARNHSIHRPRGIDELVLIYCVRGRGWAELGGTRHAIDAGSLLLLPRRLPHSYGADLDKPWTIYWCHLAGRETDIGIHLLDLDQSRPTVRVDPAVAVPLLERAVTLITESYRYRHVAAASLAIGHLFGMVSTAVVADVEATGGIAGRIGQTVEHMRRSLGESLSVAELAAMAAMSPSHYAAEFKRLHGFAVIDFFVRLKIKEACRLLDTTHATVASIATAVGYEDPLYFSRAFRRVMGRPPTLYRQVMKG